MQLRSQTQNHPRLFIKFINFLKSLKKIFTFFFLVPSIEHTNSKRSRPHSLKSVNNFASYKRKTKESVRTYSCVLTFCILQTVKLWTILGQGSLRSHVRKKQSISCGRVDQSLGRATLSHGTFYNLIFFCYLLAIALIIPEENIVRRLKAL